MDYAQSCEQIPSANWSECTCVNYHQSLNGENLLQKFSVMDSFMKKRPHDGNGEAERLFCLVVLLIRLGFSNVRSTAQKKVFH